MSGRSPTRVWRADAPAAPAIEQVQDPAVRAILRTLGRALRMICAGIDRRTGGPPPEGDDP